jgi:hypothetical protein
MSTQLAIEMKPVTSSNIQGVGYDMEIKVLQIQFKTGGAYRYKDVPLDTFDALLHADSVGKYYFARVQKHYECEKVEPVATKYDKECVYDEEIAPLMKQIIDICKREQLPFVSQFYLKQEREEADCENEALYCTSVIVPAKNEMYEEHHEHLKYVAGAMKYGKNGKPWTMAVAVTKTQE